MELLAQGARFFELLGYTLAVLALGILFAGVIWSLRLRVPGKHRTFFLVASLAALTALCLTGLLLLVLSQPPPHRTPTMQRLLQTDRGPDAEGDIDGVHKFEIYVQPDGTVLFEGQALAVEGLVPHLRREVREHERLHVTIHADAAASIGVVQPVMRHLSQHGVEFTIQVSH